MKYKAIKGMHDILPVDAVRWQFLEKTAQEHFASYGYGELRTPIVEETALFVRGVGDDTDIVQKEMYTFTDKGEDSLTLRPEGTASIVRAAVENNLINPTALHLKVYYMGPMYRRERPQKGRYRQFYQIGVENFGSPSAHADSEVIEMIDSFLKKVGLNKFSLQINSLGTREERATYLEKLTQFLKTKDGFCVDCKNRLEKNPLRILDCKNPTCISLTEGHPSILDSLGEESQTHFEEVKKDLSLFKIPFTINSKMVRGLDYYQRTVFEFISDELGSQSTVAAGGRYNDLVKDLGGPDIPGVGFALGVERLLMLLPETLKGVPPAKKIFFAFMGAEAHQKCQQLVQECRFQGIFCEMDYDEKKSLKAQLKKADKVSSTHAVILGEEEVRKGEVQLKDFTTQTQKQIPVGQLIPTLLSL